MIKLNPEKLMDAKHKVEKAAVEAYISGLHPADIQQAALQAIIDYEKGLGCSQFEASNLGRVQ